MSRKIFSFLSDSYEPMLWLASSPDLHWEKLFAAVPSRQTVAGRRFLSVAE
jgi:hypothetical protein